MRKSEQLGYLKKVLRFYAKLENYSAPLGSVPRITIDMGDKARKALGATEKSTKEGGGNG